MVMLNIKRSYGFSLVELLVAMVVGLIIVSGAFSLHSGSRKIQLKNEEQMDMVADARFAIDMIAYDLRHAGMWGATNKDGLIDCKSTDAACTSTSAGDTPPASMSGDCAAGWYYNLSRPVFAIDNSEGNLYSATCVPSSEGYRAGTDILEIRYADANVPAALLANQVYVRSNFTNGRIFVGATPPVLDIGDSDSLTQNHELHAYAYYISDHTDSAGDGIPSLRRIALANSPSVQKQTLIAGVYDLQVQFGVDVDADLEIDRYDDPQVITTNDDWDKVYAAKIWLIMRTDKIQRGINTNKDNKSFTIAGNTVTLGGQDDYRYFMVSSVVNLRNLKQF